MALQVARCGEELAAHLATVPCFTRVPFPVQIQQADLAVALPTSRAAEWLQGATRPPEIHLGQQTPDRAHI